MSERVNWVIACFDGHLDDTVFLSLLSGIVLNSKPAGKLHEYLFTWISVVVR